ncbi:N-acyl-L-homoserine lactone synthetase [Shimia sp. R9_1]|uniref:acyl-homoserine-lactone synthase n=1 Tax=unclassified Shimia TaxID=2630038 RepID=UPI001ADA4672|nr:MULTISPECIES: acyl-homoserine-lactone synthase [unclassified Shimia]MBO9396289.1 N-acyl-L-homoserine lactone synthetase [Shimia sp. R9_2]MBO9400567.1 N-acyl-L-homoserine lactone synthetase [Shimia sp. R9_3]MBO9406134.1 N-acyl-L-homoserine lactone synthetase [Shimia sp. R9_1]
MLTTTLSFENMHKHGELMVNLLRARKQSFIVQNKWDLPEVAGMEYDQYDTPASSWIAVHEGERVLAGVRLTPTTARCGMYSYMVRDAQKGMLESIPSNLLFDEAPIDPRVFDASRVFVARDVPAEQRMEVQTQLMQKLITTARSMDAKHVLGLVPAVWPRWIRRLGLVAEAAGPIMLVDGLPVQVARMDLSNTHRH